MKTRLLRWSSSLVLLCFPAISNAQRQIPTGELDPTRTIHSPAMLDARQARLPEEYMWIGRTKLPDDRTPGRPLYFRTRFNVASLPQHATLYVAGADMMTPFVNGSSAGVDRTNPDNPLRNIVLTADVGRLLHPGNNQLAIEITPGKRLSEGENYLVVKIVPAAEGVYAPALVTSGPGWKSTWNPAPGWQAPGFDDASWSDVHTFGSIESSLDFYQGNDDGGLYRWPGYVGASPFLAHTTLTARSVSRVFAGRGSYSNVNALTQAAPQDAAAFTVHMASDQTREQNAPSLLLDFGREINGRLRLVSASNHPIYVTIQYGESEGEAINQPYLGIDPLTIQPHATAYGPKSSFRYAKVRFLGGGRDLRFQSIALDAIYYPVQYRGSFESSDALLNRIWETGAYTSHLCMQDDIWDAPKRDRRRWAGDLDVSGRVIEDVFDDHLLMQDTIRRLLGSVPVKRHVNDIAGYSAWWISVLNQYSLHTGSLDYLKSLHEPLVQLMNYMDTEVDQRNLYADRTHSWAFVDWSPELNGDTPEARRATQFEYYLGYRDGARMLRELGDDANARHFEERAALLKQAAQQYLLTPATGTFGPRWQTNAISVYSGVAEPSQYAAIWDRVLSSVATTEYTAFIMSPYYNYYIISAMAETGHRPEALEWIKKYWGGMLKEGATSWWEAYYPSWPKNDFHASLQADDGTGYFVSLAHGWSSGPTAWMMEQILGIQPTADGFRQVTIRPDLAGLKWAKGAEPTPHGLLKVDVRPNQTIIDLPAGVEATVLMPVSRPGQNLLLNNKQITSAKPAEGGARAAVTLRKAGQYTLATR